jgi:hypothetical protein
MNVTGRLKQAYIASRVAHDHPQAQTKFVPSWWESEYALRQHGVTMPPRVGHAIVRALVPGGLTQILTRQALRVIRLENVTKALAPPSKPTSRK